VVSRAKELRAAIKRAGGVTRVSRELGLTRGAIYEAIAAGRLRAEHCPTVERLSGGAVRCEELNPEVDWAYLRSSEAADDSAISPQVASCAN